MSCPAGSTTALRPFGEGRIAKFAEACEDCPLAERCTTAKDGGRSTSAPTSSNSRAPGQRQSDPAWKADYKATRAKVERKISHLMRRRHGGRRARVRGKPEVSAAFALLAAAVNLARLAALNRRQTGGLTRRTA